MNNRRKKDRNDDGNNRLGVTEGREEALGTECGCEEGRATVMTHIPWKGRKEE